MEKSIVHKWSLPHPPEQVWEYLTRADLLGKWLMENDFKPVTGHKFRFTTKPKFNFGFDGIVYCEVTQVKPYTKLSYTWCGGPGNGQINLNSVVTWTLTPTSGGTELLLEHTGFKGFKNYFGYLAMNAGWKTKIFNRLLSLMTSNKINAA